MAIEINNPIAHTKGPPYKARSSLELPILNRLESSPSNKNQKTKKRLPIIRNVSNTKNRSHIFKAGFAIKPCSLVHKYRQQK